MLKLTIDKHEARAASLRQLSFLYDSWLVASRWCKRDNDALLDALFDDTRAVLHAQTVTPCSCTRKLDLRVHARHSTMPYRNGRYEDINTSRKIPVCHGIPCFSGCSGVLVEYRTHNREVAGSIHTWSTASNFEQVAKLLCAQANSASYPQRDGKWVVATAMGWKPSVADWGWWCVC